jgi:hypothetical protein
VDGPPPLRDGPLDAGSGTPEHLGLQIEPPREPELARDDELRVPERERRFESRQLRLSALPRSLIAGFDVTNELPAGLAQ